MHDERGTNGGERRSSVDDRQRLRLERLVGGRGRVRVGARARAGAAARVGVRTGARGRVRARPRARAGHAP